MNTNKKYILSIIAITLLGEMYFFPFQGNFRFSAGVIALSLVILLEEDLKEINIGVFTGLSVLGLRSTLYFFKTPNINIATSILAVYPASFYYILYGIVAFVVGLRKNKDNPMITIISLFLIDVICNIIEAIISNNLNANLFNYILLVGLVRSFGSYLIYIIFKSQELLIRKKEHQKRYSQLNTMVSNIQAEMFYLKKSMTDIENVMSKAMALNSALEDNLLRNQALDIAREVHEIKKDYFRVVKGFDNFIKQFDHKDTMSIKDIFTIIEDNILRFINESNKEIKINFTVKDNIELKIFYPLFTILNNLIINSIDACEENGTIKLVQSLKQDNIVFRLSDTGSGIEADLIPYLFSPGFTTKFDPNTGQASTGIGLSHIENILNELNGTIKVSSVVNKGTDFEIMIPLNSLGRWYFDYYISYFRWRY